MDKNWIVAKVPSESEKEAPEILNVPDVGEISGVSESSKKQKFVGFQDMQKLYNKNSSNHSQTTLKLIIK